MFGKSSRYYTLPERTWTDPQGREFVYKSFRLVPPPRERSDAFTSVGQSERLDLVAARTVGRGDLYWKLCDANLALDPFDVIKDGGSRLWVPEP